MLFRSKSAAYDYSVCVQECVCAGVCVCRSVCVQECVCGSPYTLQYCCMVRMAVCVCGEKGGSLLRDMIDDRKSVCARLSICSCKSHMLDVSILCFIHTGSTVCVCVCVYLDPWVWGKVSLWDCG